MIFPIRGIDVARLARRPMAMSAVGFCLGGASLGGLAALYGHFRAPELFGGALAMSPSLWVADRAIFPFVEARPKPTYTRVYLDCGAREGRWRRRPVSARDGAQQGRRACWIARPNPSIKSNAPGYEHGWT